LFLDDFAPGQSFDGVARVLDEASFTKFAELTGDAHPIHYDADYAAKSKFGARVAHGLLVSSVSALGATAMSRGWSNRWSRSWANASPLWHRC